MIMAFILNLKKLEVRLTKQILTQKELQKIAQAMLDQANFSMIQSQSRIEQEQKDIKTFLSTFSKNIDFSKTKILLRTKISSQKKKMKRTKDYSNTKVKTRILLTNVSYRIFKQSDFNKSVLLLTFCHFYCNVIQ